MTSAFDTLQQAHDANTEPPDVPECAPGKHLGPWHEYWMVGMVTNHDVEHVDQVTGQTDQRRSSVMAGDDIQNDQITCTDCNESWPVVDSVVQWNSELPEDAPEYDFKETAKHLADMLTKATGQLAALQQANETLVEKWRAEAEGLCGGYSLSAALAHHGLSATDGMRVAVLDDLATELEAATKEATQ